MSTAPSMPAAVPGYLLPASAQGCCGMWARCCAGWLHAQLLSRPATIPRSSCSASPVCCRRPCAACPPASTWPCSSALLHLSPTLATRRRHDTPPPTQRVRHRTAHPSTCAPCATQADAVGHRRTRPHPAATDAPARARHNAVRPRPFACTAPRPPPAPMHHQLHALPRRPRPRRRPARAPRPPQRAMAGATGLCHRHQATHHRQRGAVVDGGGGAGGGAGAALQALAAGPNASTQDHSGCPCCVTEDIGVIAIPNNLLLRKQSDK